MSIRPRHRSFSGRALNASTTRMQKMRKRFNRWEQKANERKAMFIERQKARIERYRNAFRGSWISKIGVGLLSLWSFLTDPPFVVRIEKRATAPFTAMLPFGISFGKKEKSTRRSSTTRNRLIPETLEQRQLLAADITGVSDSEDFAEIAGTASTNDLTPTITGLATANSTVYINDVETSVSVGNDASDGTDGDGLGSWTFTPSAQIANGQTFSVMEGATGATTFTADDAVTISYEAFIDVAVGESIQHAIDNLPSTGGTINLAAGTYSEHLLINKPVTLLGPNAVIDGASGSRVDEAILTGVVRVEADGVIIKGLTIDGDGVDQSDNLHKRGILVASTASQENVIIENNVIKDWVTGVSLAGGTTVGWVNDATIKGNLFVNNGIGSTENAINLTIQNNTFQDSGLGLGRGATMALPITGNVFTGNSSRYISIATGVTLSAGESLTSILDSNTFPKAVAADNVSGQWYSQAIFSNISDAINDAAADSTLTLSADTFNETLQVTKSLKFVGAGSTGTDATIIASPTNYALTVKGPSHIPLVSIKAIAFDGSESVGVRVESTGQVGSLVIEDSYFANSKYGIDLSDGSTVANISITSSTFENHSKRDINFGNFTGDATITDVTISGNTDPDADPKSDRAISIYNDAGGVHDPLGDITISGVTITGHYGREIVAIKGYNDLSGLVISGSSVRGSSDTGVLVSIDPTAGAIGSDYTPSGNADQSLDLSGLTITREVDGSTSIPDLGYDVFIGGLAEADPVVGTNARDYFDGLTNGDSVDGEDGNDIVQFAGNVGDHAISTTGGITTVDDGTSAVTVKNVESLEFAGDNATAIVVDDDDPHAFIVVKDGSNTAVKLDGAEVATIDNSSTDPIVLVGGGGDDTFTIDYSMGDPIPNIDITVEGGAQATSSPGDQLVIIGGSATTVTHTFDTANDGSVVIDGSTINYKGLEPVSDSVAATTRTFTYSNAANEVISVTASPLPGFTHRINSTHGELVDFNLPTGTLAINGTVGSDTVVIDEAISGVANVVINADTVTLNADIGGTVSGTATTANVNTGGSVQDGIDVVADGGDVVVSTHSGSGYNEALVVSNKNLTIKAGAGQTPIIDGDSLVGNGLEVNGGSNLTIEGLTFENHLISGIEVDGASDLTLIDSVINGGTFGVKVNSGTIAINGTVLDDQTSAGVFAEVNTTVTVENSEITSVNGGATSAGILVKAGAEATVAHSIVTGNKTGISVAATAMVTVTGSDLSGNILFAIDNSGAGANIVNASENWWGSDVAANVAAEVDGPVDFSPFLEIGADTDAGATGFIGDYSTLNVTALGAQVGGGPRIQEAIDHADEPTLIKVHDGTYDEVVTIGHAMTLRSVNEQGALLAPTTGAATSQAIVTVEASDVTIEDFDLLVDQDHATAGVYMETAGDSRDNLTIDNNVFRIIGTATSGGGTSYVGFGTDSTAIAIRNTDDSTSAPTVTIIDNQILPEMPGATVDAIYDRAIFLRGVNGLVDGNTVSGDSHDLAAQFVGHGTLTVSNNFFYGVGGKDTKGAQLDITEPNSHGSVSITGNTFTPLTDVVPSGSSHVRSVMIKNNTSNATITIEGNDFTVSEVGILVGNSKATTIINNTFNPLAGDSDFTHVQVSNKVPTGGTLGPVEMNATIQGNTFGESDVVGGRGIEFLNHNSTGATFGTITIGGAGILANTFEGALDQFIYLDSETQADSQASSRPYYNQYGTTTMAPFAADLNVEENLFDLGASTPRAADLDPVADLADLFALEDKIHHALDVSGLGAVTFSDGHQFVTADSGSIQRGVDAADAADTVNVVGATFVEDVNVNKAVHLLGAGPEAGGTTVSGAMSGSHATFDVNASNVEIEGFTITREGNSTTDWNDPTLSSAGISIQGPSITGTLIHDNTITGNRTAIDVNHSNGHSITNNVITDNHTGMIFRNQTDNMVVEENAIVANRTVGILFLDASSGSNSPIQTAANSSFSNNNISGNWYGQIVDRQEGASLPAAGTNIKNFSGNWFGTNQPVISTANSAEPSYESLIPVSFGGTATAPGGQPDVLGPGVENFDITSYLDSGADTDPGTFGFQGDFSTLHVIADLAQDGATGRLSEAVGLLDDSGSGGTLHIHAGDYTDDLDTTSKVVTVEPGSSPGRVVITGNVILDGNDTLSIELDGTDSATEYDNLVVTGTVTLGGATLDLVRGFSPVPGDSFTLINNDDTDAVSGTFAGIAEGDTVMVSGLPMTVSYSGGTGNDVVLTIAQPTEVWVNDTWQESSNDSGGTIGTVEPGDTVENDAVDDETVTGKTFGYNAFASLQAAVDAVADGGTVHVLDGTYDEVITIDHPITLESMTAHEAVIAPTSGSQQSVISVDAADVTIRGFSIQINQNDDGGGAPIAPVGISAVGGSSIDFDNLVIDGNMITSIGDSPANWSGSPSLSVRAAGIVLYDGSGGTVPTVSITDNVVDIDSGTSFFQRAIWLAQVEADVTGNTLSGAANDLLFQFASAGAGGDGVSVIDDNDFVGQHRGGGGGLNISGPNGSSDGITVSNNMFAPTAGDPANTQQSAVVNQNPNSVPIEFTGNDFTGHVIGISVGNAAAVSIAGNTFTPTTEVDFNTVTPAYSVRDTLGGNDFVHVAVDSDAPSGGDSTTLPIGVTIDGNTFNSSGSAGAIGTAIIVADNLASSTFATDGVEIGVTTDNTYNVGLTNGIVVSGGVATVGDNVTNASAVGVAVTGGMVKLAGSSLSDNTTGVALSGTGELTVGPGNTITGGTTGLLFDGANVALAGLDLSDLSLDGQSGNYITLANDAFDDDDLDGTGVTLGTVDIDDPGTTAAQLAVIGDKIFDELDDGSLGLVRLGTTITVTPTLAPSAIDNDYLRIMRAVEAANDGDTIILLANGTDATFNWDEAHALASWELGNDGTASTSDDWSVLLPDGLNNVTVMASNTNGSVDPLEALQATGDVTIQGPGDDPDGNLEGVFVSNGENSGWTFKHFDILDFDNAIGLYSFDGDDYTNLTIENLDVRVAADDPAGSGGTDSNQNIGLYYSGGKNITIANNRIVLDGSGTGTSFAMQSTTHGGDHYDGLQIKDNAVSVLNAGGEKIYGIWENGHAHGSDIVVSGNTFTGHAGNTNLQTAFRVTSHSGTTTRVQYNNNIVDQTDVAFDWLDVYSGTIQSYANGTPILMDGNIITNSGIGYDIGGSTGQATIIGGSVTGPSVGPAGIGVRVAGVPSAASPIYPAHHTRTASSVTVDGVLLEDLATGVDVEGNATITNLTSTDNTTGVSVYGEGNMTVGTGNTITGGTTGVVLDGSDAALAGDTLGYLSITGQNSDYVTLINGAYDDGEVDGTGLTLGSPLNAVLAMSDAELADVEAKITDVIDDSTVGLVRLQANTIVVTPVEVGSETPTDNDYTRIKNAIEAAQDGDTIVLGKNVGGSNVFDWSQSDALASWEAGNDENDTTSADEWGIDLPDGLSDVRVTADANDNIQVQGPGDVAGADLEGVFISTGETTGWTFENFSILDFDNAVGFYHTSGADFSGLTIQNMTIRVAEDGTDTFQNIGIHYGLGTGITIIDNEFNLVGGGDGTTFAIQSNSIGGSHLEGLEISRNSINVLNPGSQRIYGVWENAGAHQSNITISDNTFTGHAGNTGEQTAFRMTSHSSGTTEVKYSGNTITDATTGFAWLAEYGGNPYTFNHATGPILLDDNTVTATEVAVNIGGINSRVTLVNNNFGGGTSDNGTDVRIMATADTVTIGDGNTFAADGYFIENLSSQDIDLVGTTSTFDEADNFRIEDKMFHALDDASSGLVRVVANELFVTTPGTGLADETIQRAVDAADSGDLVNVEAGSYAENVTIDKDIDILGDAPGGTTVSPASGAAFTVLGSGVFGTADDAVTLDYINLDGGGTSTRGVFIEGTADLGTFSMSHADIDGFTSNGVYVDAVSTSGTGSPDAAALVGTVNLSDLDFTNNGTAGGGGSADVQFYGFNSNANLTNLTMVGTSVGHSGVQSAIQFRGVGEPDGTGLMPIGNVALYNVDVSGSYRTQMIGLQRYSDVANLSFTDVELGGAGSAITGNWGASLRFDGVGSGTIATPATFDLGTTTFRGLDAGSTQPHEIETAPDNSFAFLRIDGTNTSWNIGGSLVAAADLTLSQAFDVENRILHYVDKLNPSHSTIYKGFVDIQDDNAFVTDQTDELAPKDTVGDGSIQRGVDIVAVGGTV
ncbi:MAG: right-handed parallel beta-helix repeat-containing protein, partial [Rhodopirellula sp. JB053]